MNGFQFWSYFAACHFVVWIFNVMPLSSVVWTNTLRNFTFVMANFSFHKVSYKNVLTLKYFFESGLFCVLFCSSCKHILSVVFIVSLWARLLSGWIFVQSRFLPIIRAAVYSVCLRCLNCSSRSTPQPPYKKERYAKFIWWVLISIVFAENLLTHLSQYWFP